MTLYRVTWNILGLVFGCVMAKQASEQFLTFKTTSAKVETSRDNARNILCLMLRDTAIYVRLRAHSSGCQNRVINEPFHLGSVIYALLIYSNHHVAGLLLQTSGQQYQVLLLTVDRAIMHP